MGSTENRLTVIGDNDRNASGQLLPEAKERIVNEIEQYIDFTKKVNITDIARQLNLDWGITDRYVNEVVERWRKQDIARLQKYRRQLTEMADIFISDAEREGANISLNKMKDMINLFKEIASIARLEQSPVGDSGNGDARSVVAVHFNNMSLTGTMMKDLEKVRNGQSIEVQPITETEPVIEQPPVIQTDNGTTDSDPGYTGSESPVI